MITRESLKQQKDIKIEKVEIPEWNSFVYVKSLTGKERDSFEDSMYTGRSGEKVNLKNLRARLVVLTMCNENGKRIFSDEDADWVGDKNAAALNRIFVKAQELSGLRQEDVERLVKNSNSAPGAESTSESAEN